MTILAKPTVYQGIRFRSRLEARWAVFFDTLGLPWTYEPSVGGVRYQPDFEIGNNPAAYIETKPDSWFELSESRRWTDIRDRWAALVKATDRNLIVLTGEPGRWENGRLDSSTFAMAFSPKSVARDPMRPWSRASWVECFQCGSINIVNENYRICGECPSVGKRILAAMNAVRDTSYSDAP